MEEGGNVWWDQTLVVSSHIQREASYTSHSRHSNSSSSKVLSLLDIRKKAIEKVHQENFKKKEKKGGKVQLSKLNLLFDVIIFLGFVIVIPLSSLESRCKVIFGVFLAVIKTISHNPRFCILFVVLLVVFS